MSFNSFNTVLRVPGKSLLTVLTLLEVPGRSLLTVFDILGGSQEVSFNSFDTFRRVPGPGRRHLAKGLRTPT